MDQLDPNVFALVLSYVDDKSTKVLQNVTKTIEFQNIIQNAMETDTYWYEKTQVLLGKQLKWRLVEWETLYKILIKIFLYDKYGKVKPNIDSSEITVDKVLPDGESNLVFSDYESQNDEPYDDKSYDGESYDDESDIESYDDESDNDKSYDDNSDDDFYNDEFSPITAAAKLEKYSAETVSVLIEAGYRSDTDTLIGAINSCNLDTAEVLITEGKVDPSIIFDYGLIVTTQNCDKSDVVNLVKLLLKDNRVTEAIKRNSVLSQAIRHENYEIVKLLLKDSRINPDVEFLNIQYVAKTNMKMLEILLSDNRIYSSIGDYIIKSIINKYVKTEIVELLFNHPRFNPVDLDVETIYNIARNDATMLEILLSDSRFDPSVGDNIIIRSVVNNDYVNIETIKLLLEDPRVDPTANNNEAIIGASRANRLDIINLLIKDPRTDPTGQNSLVAAVAANNHNYDLLKLLMKDGRTYPLESKRLRSAVLNNDQR